MTDHHCLNLLFPNMNPMKNVDELRLVQIFETLQQASIQCERELINLNFNLVKTAAKLYFLQFYKNGINISIKTCVTVERDMTPIITVHRKQVPWTHEVYDMLTWYLPSLIYLIWQNLFKKYMYVLEVRMKNMLHSTNWNWRKRTERLT